MIPFSKHSAAEDPASVLQPSWLIWMSVGVRAPQVLLRGLSCCDGRGASSMLLVGDLSAWVTAAMVASWLRRRGVMVQAASGCRAPGEVAVWPWLRCGDATDIPVLLE